MSVPIPGTFGHTSTPVNTSQPVQGLGSGTNGSGGNLNPLLPQRSSSHPTTGPRTAIPNREIPPYHQKSGWSSTELSGICDIEDLIVEITDVVTGADGKVRAKHPQLEGFVEWVFAQDTGDLKRKLGEEGGNADRLITEWMTEQQGYADCVVQMANQVANDMAVNGKYKADYDAFVQRKDAGTPGSGQLDPEGDLARKYLLGEAERDRAHRQAAARFVQDLWGPVSNVPQAQSGVGGMQTALQRVESVAAKLWRERMSADLVEVTKAMLRFDRNVLDMEQAQAQQTQQNQRTQQNQQQTRQPIPSQAPHVPMQTQQPAQSQAQIQALQRAREDVKKAIDNPRLADVAALVGSPFNDGALHALSPQEMEDAIPKLLDAYEGRLPMDGVYVEIRQFVSTQPPELQARLLASIFNGLSSFNYGRIDYFLGEPPLSVPGTVARLPSSFREAPLHAIMDKAFPVRGTAIYTSPRSQEQIAGLVNLLGGNDDLKGRLPPHLRPQPQTQSQQQALPSAQLQARAAVEAVIANPKDVSEVTALVGTGSNPGPLVQLPPDQLVIVIPKLMAAFEKLPPPAKVDSVYLDLRKVIAWHDKESQSRILESIFEPIVAWSQLGRVKHFLGGFPQTMPGTVTALDDQNLQVGPLHALVDQAFPPTGADDFPPEDQRLIADAVNRLVGEQELKNRVATLFPPQIQQQQQQRQQQQQQPPIETQPRPQPAPLALFEARAKVLDVIEDPRDIAQIGELVGTQDNLGPLRQLPPDDLAGAIPDLMVAMETLPKTAKVDLAFKALRDVIAEQDQPTQSMILTQIFSRPLTADYRRRLDAFLGALIAGDPGTVNSLVDKSLQVEPLKALVEQAFRADTIVTYEDKRWISGLVEGLDGEPELKAIVEREFPPLTWTQLR